MYYVGETGGRVKKRFSEILRAVASYDICWSVTSSFKAGSHRPRSITGSNDSRKDKGGELSKLRSIHPLVMNQCLSYINIFCYTLLLVIFSHIHQIILTCERFPYFARWFLFKFFNSLNPYDWFTLHHMLLLYIYLHKFTSALPLPHSHMNSWRRSFARDIEFYFIT